MGFPGSDHFYADARAAAEPAAPSGRLDVLGLGQAMIDFSASVDDAWLVNLDVAKSARKLISVGERAAVLERLQGQPTQVAAGGSLSNTLMGLARLGAALGGDRSLRVGMAGLVGEDPLGAFYAAQMAAAGVEVVSPPTPGANTGTVVVLSTADAARTMLSYLGTPAPVPLSPALAAAIGRSSVLVVEGYLWELPGAAATIRGAIAAARASGTAVAMTAGDAGVVARHGAEMWEAIDAGIDLLFTNAGEAAALAACAGADAPAAPRGGWTAEAAALALAPHCSLVAVTDGANGSVITALGQLHTVPPHWTEAPPVDTCGAGDAYAAGLLLGFLRGLDVATMGRVAARTASAVIARHGGVLCEAGAARVAAALPAGAESMARAFGKGGAGEGAPGAVTAAAARSE